MKIMHLISGGDVSGAKTHVISLLEELCKHQEVELVCFIDGPFAEDARNHGIPTRVLKKRNLLRIARELKKYLKNKGFDILHCHGSKANVVSWLMGRNVSCPVLSTIHSDPRLDYLGRPFAEQTIGRLNRFALRRRDGWSPVSDAMKACMAERGYDGDRMWPIYNGVEVPKHIPHRPRQEYLNSLGLPWGPEHVIFGIAARIDPVKDMVTLVRAFARTVEQVPNARLLIAGKGSQEGEIRALVQELCPAGTVHFAGWVEDMNSFYHALDVNMLTSISETFSYAITEGARMCCATICTAVGGLPQVVIDGETGYLIEVGDVDTMAQRMTELASDPLLRGRFGRAIYEKVRAEFSVTAMGKRQVEIYRALQNRVRRAASGRDGVVICGAYGKGNAGDDAILLSMIAQLRARDPDLPITVMTRKPRQTAVQTGVSTVHIFNIPGVERRLRRSKLYISGGGSLIQNVTSARSLYYYLFSIAQAKRAGCKVMMYGCGIGPVHGDRDQQMAANVLRKNVDLIALRDRDSAQTLNRFGCADLNIHLTADPALLMEANDAAAVRYLRKNGLDPEGKYALFVLRPWEGTGERLEAICAAARRSCPGLQPLFYALEPDRDLETAHAAAKLVPGAVVLPPVSDGATLCGIMGRMKLVVSMRLHALIFACAQGTPVAAISYDPKVSGFMAYLGSENCVELADATEEAVAAIIQTARATKTAPKIDHLKHLAAENARLAIELMQGA